MIWKYLIIIFTLVLSACSGSTNLSGYFSEKPPVLGVVTTTATSTGSSNIATQGSSFVFTKGTAIAPVTPGSGGTVTIVAYAISPSLPAGLTLDPSTGIISGTPTVLMVETAYALAGTDRAGDSVTLNFNITVDDQLPSVVYSPASVVLTKGTPMSALSPTSTGGAVVTYTSTSLPAGLSLASATGIISGTPTAVTAETLFTITATNSGGSSTTPVTLTVNDIPPVISYSPSSYTYNNATTVSTSAATSTGGAVITYSAASLPAGLVINASTGEISGRLTTAISQTNYTITATNSGGSSTAAVQFTVNEVPPVIAYSPGTYVFTKGSAISSVSPTSTGGTVVTYAEMTSLPTGLSINSSTGVISGTPTAISSLASYTIKGTNGQGNDSTSITITVNDTLPVITYSPSTSIFTKGTAISSLTPTSTGGAVISYSATLPAGLSINSSTGVVSGTPTAITATNNYTITATNSGGSSTATLNLTVNDVAPVISYPSSPYVFGQAISSTTGAPTNSSAGTILTYSISPTSLPAGLSFNTSTGVVSGTPTALTSATSYTVTATNSGGSSSTTLSLKVALTMTPSSADTFETISPATVQIGSPQSFTVTPTSGHALTTVTGTCPAGTWSSSVYTVTATSSCTVIFNGVAAPPVSLTSQFNFIGIENDSSTFSSGAGFDHNGNAFSSTCIPAAVTALGVSFSMGSAGVDDMFNSSVGLEITLPSAVHYSKIYMIAAGVNGTLNGSTKDGPSGTFTVTYTDSTTATFTQTFSDWHYPRSYANETTVGSCPYRDTYTGGRDSAGPFAYFAYSFAVDDTKYLSTLLTPANENIQIMAITVTP